MLNDLITSLAREAIWVTIIVSIPAIMASLLVGLLVALFSATTQIQEQTLSFAPKMVAVYLSILACGAPMGAMLLNFAKRCFTDFTFLTLGQ
jgi:flagellar biosynthetic protein FliQ